MAVFFNPVVNKADDTRSRAAFSWPVLSLLAVFVPAIAIRLLFLALLDTDFLFYKYPYFAEKLAAGESIGDRLADLSPFYLYLLTLYRWLTPLDWTSLKVIQALVGALNCWITAVLGKQIFDNRAIGIIAGLGLAAYGNLIILETTLEPTVFVIFFNLLAVYGLYRHADGFKSNADMPNCRWLLCSAGFTGLAIITKPSFLLFVPLACLWLLILNHRKIPLLKTAGMLALFCGISLSVVFCITLRNYLLLDDRILVTADAGKVFFHGNSREATALKWAGLPDQGFTEEGSQEPDYAHVAFRNLASQLSGRELRPSEASKFWTRKTLDDIVADPGRYLSLQLDKLLFFLSDYELHYIASAYREYKISLTWPFLHFATLAALGLTGMFMARNAFIRLIPVYGMVLLYLTSGLIFVVQSRYRIPMMPYMCLFAAGTCHGLYLLFQKKRFKMILALAVGIVCLLAVSRMGLKEQIAATDSWFQATKLHYEMGARVHFKAGRYSEAIESANRTLEIAPGFAPAYNLRGKSRALLGDNRTAMEDFKMVIHLRPNRPEGYRNLGYAYLSSHDEQAALDYLKRALSLDPANQKVRATIENLSQPGRTMGGGRS